MYGSEHIILILEYPTETNTLSSSGGSKHQENKIWMLSKDGHALVSLRDHISLLPPLRSMSLPRAYQEHQLSDDPSHFLKNLTDQSS